MGDDVEALGVHCASCGSIDFLPITCAGCRKAYCRQHAQQDAHACPSRSSSITASSAPTTDPVAVYKAAHTSLKTTKRAGEEEKEAKRAAALALLARNFPAKAPTASMSAAKKPLNHKLVLMKLKQRAKPADPKKRAGDVALGDRLHLEVQCEGKEAALWIAKDATAGKALDLFASALGASNVNNSSARTQRLSLHLVDRDSSEPGPALSLQQALQTLNIADGSSMVLLRGQAA